MQMELHYSSIAYTLGKTILFIHYKIINDLYWSLSKVSSWVMLLCY
jgi:hypothetical protein